MCYYETIKRKTNTSERLKTKSEESTHLGYTGLFGKLEHLKIKTRLTDEKFVHWVVRGTGTPKDKVEVNRREVCECDG
jgi:hypothetical protein